MMNIAIFDVGGTFIKYSVMVNGVLSHRGKVETPYQGQEKFLETIEDILKSMDHIKGIAFSMPGVIDVERKVILSGGSLTYNQNTNVHDWEQRFHLPIEIENDARCAAIAELEVGTMKNIQNGLVVTFGTGIGGGIIINGELYKGSHLIGGELSGVFVRNKREYGLQGLFGQIGSVYQLITKIANAKSVNTNDGKKVFQWIEKKDPIACQIFKDYCQEVANAFHNIQCVLDPQRISIGGGISENPLFISGIQKAIEEFYQSIPIAFPHAEIMKCQYCNDANMLGAYFHYIKHNDER